MKTDRVLTLCEYLDQWGVVSMHVAPPADNACHVPITSEADICPKNEEHACRCDRWGHPCTGCQEKHELQPRAASQNPSANK